jgi:hypothetical protein
MSEQFTRILLGHLVGDYLLQSKAMAIKKSERTFRGQMYCLAHCLIYTATVCLFLKKKSWRWLTMIFLTHWPIDRWSLASKWLWMIRGRDVIAAFQSKDEYALIDLIFSCLVYATTDNTMHLLLMWLLTKKNT